MTGIEIRPGRIEDSPAIADMLARLAAELGDSARFSSNADVIRRHGFGDTPLFRCFLAEKGAEFLGLALYFPVFSTTRGRPGIYVQDLWVNGAARGTGLGRKLLAEAAEAAASEWDAAYLMLTVYNDNEGAMAFYRKLGFSGEERDQPLAIEGGRIPGLEGPDMKTVFHATQRRHDPKSFLSSGAPKPNPEQPARIDALLAGAVALDAEVISPIDQGLGPIAALHTAEYLSFLQTIYTRWQRIEGASEEVIPNIHPDRRTAGYPKSAVGQAGYHMADTACPISEQTWESSYWSAQSAITAADLVLGGETAAYALCRPPGHHAFSDLAGGFCFLNNTAIAAERCLRAGRRPAILDVDLHHGNGTQGIFLRTGRRAHGLRPRRPERYYPFFWGYAQERGAGAGLGANLNLPISRGSGDAEFLKSLDSGLKQIKAFGADVLIVALGLDAFEGDPFGGLAITTPGFAGIGAACASLGLPSVIVQEGGYLCPELGDNLNSFLSGFSAASQNTG